MNSSFLSANFDKLIKRNQNERGILRFYRDKGFRRLRMLRFAVFDFRRFSSSEMSNGFMVLQYVLHLIGQVRIDFRQSFRQILVHRTLGNTEFLSNGANRVFRLDNAGSNLNGPLFDVIVQSPRLPTRDSLVHYMRGRTIYST
jgi:hypothetical protein